MKNTVWSADHSQIPTLKPHTRAKHQLLERYIEQWVYIHCKSHPAYQNKITIIDGFCGGGIYQTEDNLGDWEGSPFRLIRGIERGHKRVCDPDDGGKVGHKLEAQFIFIDNTREHINSLKKAFRERGLDQYLRNGKCSFLCGDFSKYVDHCLDATRNGQSFFLLDPFGVDDIRISDIRKIMSLRKAEILWTFMISGITRLLPNRAKYRHILDETLDLSGYFRDLPNSKASQRHCYLRNESLTFIREKSDVEYIYPFSLMENKNTVLYYLVHLANSVKAIEVMKDSMWKYNNLECRYHYDIYGIGYRTFEEMSGSKLYDIDQFNQRELEETLDESVLRVIYQTPLSYQTLRKTLVEKNPGSGTHLLESLYRMRRFHDLEIVKPNGGVFSGESASGMKSDYIIRVPRQGKLFDLKSF